MRRNMANVSVFSQGRNGAAEIGEAAVLLERIRMRCLSAAPSSGYDAVRCGVGLLIHDDCKSFWRTSNRARVM